MGFIQRLHRTREGLQSPTHTLLGRGCSPEHGCLHSSLPSCALGLRLVKPKVMDTISQLLSVEAAAAKREEEGCWVPELVSSRMSCLPAWASLLPPPPPQPHIASLLYLPAAPAMSWVKLWVKPLKLRSSRVIWTLRLPQPHPSPLPYTQTLLSGHPEPLHLPQRVSLLLTSRLDAQAAPSAKKSFPPPSLGAANPSHLQRPVQTIPFTLLSAATPSQPLPSSCLLSPGISPAWDSLAMKV